MKKCTALVAFLLLFTIAVRAKEKTRSYYQITVYHFATLQQEQALDTYLKDAYLPALHRTGVITLGVFKPIANEPCPGKCLHLPGQEECCR